MSERARGTVRPRHSSRRRGRLFVGALLAAVACAVPAAGQAVKPIAAAEPLIRDGVGTLVSIRLRSGFAVAMRQVRDAPQCRAMFESLGADPERLLLQAEYRPATREQEATFCSRRAVAMTHVGQASTWVCRTFSALTSHEAALVVLHEALHFGGLTESPGARDAMSSGEINLLVASRCRP